MLLSAALSLAVLGCSKHAAAPGPDPGPRPERGASAQGARLQAALVDGRAHMALTEARLRAALRGAAKYLARRELRGDQSWLASQAAQLLGDEYTAWAAGLRVTAAVRQDAQRDPLSTLNGRGVEGWLWELRALDTPQFAAASKSPKAPTSPLPTPPFDDAQFDALKRLMALTVSCTRLSTPQTRELIAALQAPERGYLLTHQLLALDLAVAQGCLEPALRKTLRQRLGAGVLRELRGDAERALDDLTIERMAALCHTQLCTWVPQPRIVQLVAEQAADGGWGARDPKLNPHAFAPEAHTAALAFYVLAAVLHEQAGGVVELEPP